MNGHATSRSVLVLGAGGHAKVVVELLRADPNVHIAGCTAEPGGATSVMGVPVLGRDDDVLPKAVAAGIRHAIVAIGSNAARERLAARLAALGLELVNAISPAACVSPSARLGKGIAIMPGAVLNADVTVADLAIVNTRASIDHECSVGRAAHIAPGTTLCGNVEIGAAAFVGAGSVVIPGKRIGERAVVGAGSVVIADIPADGRVAGVPARPLRPGAPGQA